jgi:hypothetical protein
MGLRTLAWTKSYSTINSHAYRKQGKRYRDEDDDIAVPALEVLSALQGQDVRDCAPQARVPSDELRLAIDGLAGTAKVAQKAADPHVEVAGHEDYGNIPNNQDSPRLSIHLQI